MSPDDTAFLLDKFDVESSGVIDAKVLSKHFLPNNYGTGNSEARSKPMPVRAAAQGSSTSGAAAEERAMKELHRKVIERVLVKSKTQNIKDAFRQYDTDRKGYLTLPQFRTFVRDHGFAGTEVERLIKYLDRDSQGAISFHAFSGDVKLGANQAYPKASPKKQQLAQPLGKQDGSPSKRKSGATSEYQDPMESIRAKLRQRVMGHSKSIREVFMDFDDDSNGYLDYDEFKRFMTKYNFTQDEVCQAIGYLDRDFSGTIDYDEFASGLLFFRPPVVPAPAVSVSVASTHHSNRSSPSKLSPAEADRVVQVVQQRLGEKLKNAHGIKSARKKLREDFIKYDSENKNGLDYQEFGAFLVGMGIKLKADELSALLATIDTDSSETIEFEELAKLYRAGGVMSEEDDEVAAGGSGMRHADKDERLLAVFNKYDIDGSGFLDYEEFAQLMRDYGFSETDILHVIKQIGQDEAASGRRSGKNGRSKGKVNYKTFSSVAQRQQWKIHDSPTKTQTMDSSAAAAHQQTLWVTRVLQKHRSLEEAFRGHDADGSGELDYDEFRRFMKHYGMRNDGEIDALIDRLDGDGNETISLDEFMHEFGRAKVKGGKQKQPQTKQDAKAQLASLRERELQWIQSVLSEYNSVEDAFRDFDRDDRNELDYQQFRALMEQFGISSNDDISLLTRRLDADNSGTIDLEEFLSVFNKQRLAHQKSTATNIKKDKPVPSAALLQKRERASQLRKTEEVWIQRAAEAHGSINVAFEKFNLNQSGELDYDEFRQFMSAFGISDREHIEALIKRLDVDKSGCISYEEFITVFYEERVEKNKASAHAQPRRTSAVAPAMTPVEAKKSRALRQRELEVKWMKRVLSCHQSIESAFNEYDIDGSCTLDHNEFIRFMKRYGIVRDDDISSLIKRLDLDGSGTIDFEEFSSIFNPLRVNQGGHGNGGLADMLPGVDEEPFAPEELESILEIERELALRMLEKTRDLRSAFRKYDLNGNGRLEYKEFRQVLRAYRFPEPEIRKVIRHLDRDVSGFIDYKEFIAGFTVTKDNERGSPGGTRKSAKYQVASVQKPGNGARRNTRASSVAHGEQDSSDTIERLKKDLLSKILATYGTVQSVFRQYDEKQQGRLSEKQFEALVMDHGLTRSDAQVLLNVFDQDRSGTIEYEEFLAQLVVRVSM